MMRGVLSKISKYKPLLILAILAMLMLAHRTDITERNKIPLSKLRLLVGDVKPKYESSVTMLDRSRRIAEICSQWPYNNTRKYVGAGRSITSAVGNRLLYCPVPKAAWSTWKRLFYREVGLEHLMSDLFHTGFLSQWEKAGLKVIKNVNTTHYKHKLVFTRNPYGRLLSAYKDKVLTDNGKYVRHFQHPCKTFNDPPLPALTFPQFVKCIMQEAHTYYNDTSVFGTGGTMDYHWRPQTLLCNFCESNYNIIGQMEHIDEDLVEALRKLQMNTTLVKENVSQSNKTKQLPLAYWYNQLDSSLLDEIKKFYSHDFAILGYDPRPPSSATNPL